MMSLLRFALLASFLASAALAADVPALWRERLQSVVAVEFYAETEAERRTGISYGTVIDEQGTIVLPPVAVNPRLTPSQLKDFKVYRPGEPESTPAEYLGQDPLTGWHFVRAGEAVRKQLVPITRWASRTPREPALAEDLWGIGLRNKDEDFFPYILKSHVALVQSLPQRTAILQQEVAGPGLPAFDMEGNFAGLGLSSFGQNYVQFSNEARGGRPVILVNVEESGALLTAGEVLPYLKRVPQNVFGRPLAWLGAYALEPIDREAARFLKLGNQSAAVISEVTAGSPAEAGGLKDRDIILAIDGQTLPRFRPDGAVVQFVGREVLRRRPGDLIRFTVLRGSERAEVEIRLGEQPKLLLEAERQYFDRLGLTAREFVYDDAVMRRADPSQLTGVVAHFVKPNGSAAIAGLGTDDWIKEIDGEEIRSFAAAKLKLAAIEADRTRGECVLLVSRGGDTAVLRVKLQ
ncbi:MAG: PDZ domain-containing protein [Opitutus sp.]|nr:PDZ domain-containing protein [Opitutus sp.]